MIKLLVDYEGPTATDTTSQGWNTLFMKVSITETNDMVWPLNRCHVLIEIFVIHVGNKI